MFRPPSYVTFLPQFHSLNTRDKINMINPSKDTPNQPISTSPPTPTLSVNAIWGVVVHVPKVQATDVQFKSWANHRKMFTYWASCIALVLCYFYLAGLVLRGCFFLVFFSFTFLLGHLIYCTLPLSDIKVQNVLHEVFFVVCLSGCVVVWGLFVWLFFFLLFVWLW